MGLGSSLLESVVSSLFPVAETLASRCVSSEQLYDFHALGHVFLWEWGMPE